MKNVKKIMALMLAMVMVLSMAIPAMAHTTGTTVTGHLFTYDGTDKTDNGEIKLSNATIDVTYTLYKVFDATYDAEDPTKVAYTVKDGALKEALDSDYFTVGATPDAAGNYSVTRTGTIDSTTGQFTPTKTDAEVITYIQTLTANFANIGSIKSDVNGEIKWEKIPYGYYYISPDKPTSPKAAVTIDTVNPTVTVIDKNQVITDEKNIIETVNGQEIKKKVNEAGLNEDIDYRITVNATNYDKEKKIYEYVICDNIEAGMTFKAETAPVIKVDGIAVPADQYTIKYYTDKTKTTEVTGSDLSTAQYFEISIIWTDTGKWSGTHLHASNSVLTVEYTAFLDPNKREQLVIGGTNDGNTNEAQVKWYSDIEEKDKPKEPNGTNPEKYTDTFTTELTILKKDQDGKALQGAEFTLTGPQGAVVITKTESFVKDASGAYWKLKDGTYTTQDPDGTIDGKPVDKDKYESLTDKYKVTTTYNVVGAGQTLTDIKVEVGTDGKATFTGLGAGKYKLVETKVPAGYNKVDDIEFEITMTEADDTTSKTGKKVTFDTDNDDITVEADNTLSMDVINKKGTELPSTGGIGTTMFYVVGSILVIGAAVLLISKRRMSTR